MQASAVHPFELLLDIDSRCRGRSAAGPEDAAQLLPLAGRLAVRVKSWRFVFVMHDVSEIIPVPRVTPVPGVKDWLLGIANLRGTVISMIDLGQFLTGDGSERTAASRVVVVHADEWRYGLLVDEVIGMRRFEHTEGVTAVVDEHLQPFVRTVFQGENYQWLAFDVGALLNDGKFLNAAI